MVLMFARTVALQVGRMALIDPTKSVAGVTLRYFTPYYTNPEQIINRHCMETKLNGPLLQNIPT